MAPRFLNPEAAEGGLVHLIGKRKIPINGESQSKYVKNLFESSGNILNSNNNAITGDPSTATGNNNTTTMSNTKNTASGAGTTDQEATETQVKPVFNTSKVVTLKTSALPVGTVFQDCLKKEIGNQIKTGDEFNQWNERICGLIVQEFIKVDAPNELNIDGGIKSSIVKRMLQDKSPSLFRSALNSVILNIYQSSFTEFKKKVVLTNIGDTDRRMRLIFAIFMFIVSMILTVLLWTIWRDNSSYLRLIIFPCLQTGFVSILQYKTKFCVMHGFKGTSSKANRISEIMDFAVHIQTKDTCARMTAKSYAFKLIGQTTILSLLVQAMILGIPPYQF